VTASWITSNGGSVCRFNVDARQAREALTETSLRDAGARQPIFMCRSVGSAYYSNRVNLLHEDRRRRIRVGTDGLLQLVRTASEWHFELMTLEALRETTSVRSHGIQ
jgi:hypothetical protein